MEYVGGRSCLVWLEVYHRLVDVYHCMEVLVSTLQSYWCSLCGGECRPCGGIGVQRVEMCTHVFAHACRIMLVPAAFVMFMNSVRIINIICKILCLG